MNQLNQKAQEVSRHFAQLPQVAAIALSGSQASGAADGESDIDLYVYTKADIPLQDLKSIIEITGGATRSDLDLPYWGGVNMWVDALTEITIDCIYFDKTWMENQVTRVMVACQPELGYSTCFCRTVRQSHILHDPDGWFAALQSLARQDYPEQLRLEHHPPQSSGAAHNHDFLPAPDRKRCSTRRHNQHTAPVDCPAGQLLRYPVCPEPRHAPG